MPALVAAPAWRTTRWFNVPARLALADLRGRVVCVCAFQMLCQGCVSLGLPQARRVAETFRPDDVAVVGLHAVFERHAAMTPESLEVFLREHDITFPVGVDEPDGDRVPHTMRAYAMQGTPTTLLIDRQGRLRRHVFGHLPDLQLGAEIMALIGERMQVVPAGEAVPAGVCTPGGCT